MRKRNRDELEGNMNFLKMYCVHCKGVVVANDEKDILNCPYCGALFVVRQAVKDYQINIGNTLDAQLRYSLESSNISEDSQRKVEYKIIEQKPIITPISNSFDEAEQIQENDEIANEQTDEPLDVVEESNDYSDFSDSEDMNESDEIESFSEQNDSFDGSKTTQGFDSVVEDNQNYETFEKEEENDCANCNEGNENDAVVDENDGESVDEVENVETFEQQSEAPSVMEEQQLEQNEVEEEEVEVVDGQTDDAEAGAQTKDNDEFVNPFESQQSFQNQLKELFYKAHPEAEFEQQEEVVEEEETVVEEEVATPEIIVEPKQEFKIINDVLEVYDGDGETATIPDEVVKINGSAFFSCKNLKNIVIGKNVQYISDGAFVHCANIETISIDRENQNYRSNGNCIVDVRQKMLIFGCKNTVIPNDGSVLRIGAGAFADCVGLVSMKIPEGITFIGNSAFKNCSNLQQVNIPASASYIALNAFEKTGLLDVSVSGGGLKKCLRCGSEMPYGSNACVCGCSYTIK